MSFYFRPPVTSLKASRDLIAEQDKEYQDSLLADQKKEEERREKLLSEIRDAEQQEQLQQARLHRVPDEPKSGSMVLIQVRHVTLGVIKRNFSSNDKMLSVYDWVGSLSLLPPYFELLDYRGQVLRPKQSIVEGDKSTLNMSASESTPSLDDDDIDFKGFGTTVPLKSKLTLKTRTSRLDPRASMLETFEDRVSSIESRVSRIESRGSRNRVFSNMQKLERVSRKRFISRRKNTVLLTP